MNNIYDINNIDLNNLSLNNPTSMKGSAHISKLKYNNDSFYIQFPKCKSKNGIIITGKSKYIDIMYNNDDINIINWFENLEETLQDIIYTKSNEWFDNTIEKNDIESAFLSSIRLYKSGSLYLIRVQIPNSIINNLCYNENTELINYTLVNNTSEFIPLLEFSGIKFTSTTFQLIINIKQLLLIDPINFDKCIINYNNNLSNANHVPITKESAINTNNNPDTRTKTNDDNTVIINPLCPNVFSQNDNEGIIISNTARNEDNNVDNNINNNVNNTVELDETEIKVAKENNADIDQTNMIDNSNDPTTKTKLEFAENENNENNENDENNENNENDENNENNEDIETVGIINDSLEDLEEVNIVVNETMPSVNIKNPNEIYHALWEKTYNKAKELKIDAIKAFLEAKTIKNTYLVNQLDDIDDDNLEELNNIE